MLAYSNDNNNNGNDNNCNNNSNNSNNNSNNGNNDNNDNDYDAPNVSEEFPTPMASPSRPPTPPAAQVRQYS